MTDHNALAAELRYHHEMTGFQPLAQAADALAALGDTVPASTLSRVVTSYEEALREVWAERDALAHVIEQARRVPAPDVQSSWRDRAAEVETILCAAPAVPLALHDAEVWDEGETAGALNQQNFDGNEFTPGYTEKVNPYRAAATREEAK